MQRKSVKTLFGALTLAIILSACGGGGGGSNGSSTNAGAAPDQPATGKTLSGKAIDGYLSNATVCVDLNYNGACDAGEPAAKTDDKGNYSIAYSGDLTGKKLLVVIDPNTRDQNRPNYVFPATFALTASVDGDTAQNVTPLTTMQQSLMENGYSKDDATAAVVSFVGGAVNLRDDYVANGDNNTTAFAAKVVDKVAEFAKNGNADADVVRGVMNAVVIKGGIDNVTQADVDALAAKPVLSTDVDAKTVLAGGLYAHHEYLLLNMQRVLMREHFIQTGDGVRNALEANVNGQWTEPDTNSYGSYIGNYQLKADGSWSNLISVADQQKFSTVQSATGNTVTLTDAITGGTTKIELRKVVVGGKTFVDAMTGWIEDYVRTQLQGGFKAGQVGYVTISTRSDDLVHLDQWNCFTNNPALTVSEDGLTHCNWVGDHDTTYTSIDQIIGTPVDLNGQVRTTLNADGTGTMVDKFSNKVIAGPGQFTWTRHAKNPNVIIFNVSNDLLMTAAVPYSNEVYHGHKLGLALHGGHIEQIHIEAAPALKSVLNFDQAGFNDLFAAEQNVQY